MKHLISLSLIIICAFGLQAQEESRWSLRANAGITNAIIQDNISPTSNLFSPQLGASMAYKLSERWDISAGLTVSQRGYKQHGVAIWGRDNFNNFQFDRIAGPGSGTTFYPDPVIGCPLPTPPVGASLDDNKHRITFLEVPISARFYLNKSDFQLFVSPGLTYMLPVSFSPKTTFIHEDGSIEVAKDRMWFPPMRRIPIVANLSVGSQNAHWR